MILCFDLDLDLNPERYPVVCILGSGDRYRRRYRTSQEPWEGRAIDSEGGAACRQRTLCCLTVIRVSARA